MSAMNGFGYWSPADEDQYGCGAGVLLGLLMGALFVGVPLCIVLGWL